MNNSLANVLLRTGGYIWDFRPQEWAERFDTMQWWDEERMRGWQSQELSKMLQHVSLTVPYYRETYPAFSSEANTDPFSYLSSCPILTKDDLRENFADLQSTDPTVGRTKSISTSGSTGKPLKLMVDRAGLARYFAAKIRALGWYDVKFADRQVRIWGLTADRRKQINWRLRDLFQNRLRLVSFDLSDERLEEFYQQCLRFQPVYINGYTSGIHRFAQFIKGTGEDGRSLGLRLIVPTSEVLLESQAREMEDVFGCPIMNDYGGGEAQALAIQCPEGKMHISHENVYVEVLDEDGLPVPDGHTGLITVTSFCNRAVPLIRYQNGDLVTLEANATCKCGRHIGLPALGRIMGRSADVLYRTDGQPAHWTVIYYAIKEKFEPGMIIEHQARQKDCDLMEILVVKGTKYDETAKQNFLAEVRNQLGQEMRIEMHFVESIPRENSGKFRYFVSDMAVAQLPDK